MKRKCSCGKDWNQDCAHLALSNFIGRPIYTVDLTKLPAREYVTNPKNQFIMENNHNLIVNPLVAPNNNNEDYDETECIICMDNMKNTMFVPCGHICVCDNCHKGLRNCPICRITIDGSNKII